MNATDIQPCLLTPGEVGAIVRLMREQMVWSQEALAEFAGLTVSLVQDLEAGQRASAETRRVVAGAFGWPPAFLDTPRPVPTAEDLAAQEAAFHLEYLILDAFPVDGRGIVTRLMDVAGAAAMMPCSFAELPRTAQNAFTMIADYVHSSLDNICEASEADAAHHIDKLTALTGSLKEAGYQLHAAIRHTWVSNPTWSNLTPMPLTVLYVIAAPDGHMMTQCAVRRHITI